MSRSFFLAILLTIGLFAAIPAAADSLLVSTGNPDGLIAMASRPGSPGKIEIEAADDFILSGATSVTGGSFVGLLPSGTSLTSISQVVVEIYRVFPNDSTNPASGNVLTRVNSPSDVAFASRDFVTGGLNFTPTLLSGSFTASNSVVNGINKLPNQFTGGEGSVTGEEVSFNVAFTTPFDLPADHYFFVPQVLLTSGDFLWLSAPKPIVAPGTPFSPDLQTWMRNANLDPDWSRVGTDITHQGPFNGTFTLNGSASVPEASTLLLLGTGLLGLVGFTLKKAIA
jgi:PEP-CTERM motif